MGSKSTRRTSIESGDEESSINSGIRCRCQRFVKTWTSNTLNNPGRRFMRCPNYKDPSKCCNFFQWIDPKVLKTSVEEQNHEEQKVEDVMFDFQKALKTSVEEIERNQKGLKTSVEEIERNQKALKTSMEEITRNQSVIVFYNTCILVLLGIVLVILLV